MSDTTCHLAIDLGAESGRGILGVLDAGTLTTHEVHRFVHAPQRLGPGLCWDLNHLCRETLRGIELAAAWCDRQGLPLTSVGVDTWGVDFVLIDAQGIPLAPPRCDRDPRHEPAAARLRARLGAERLDAESGIQFLALNTIYQLASIREEDPDLLDRAHCLLFMPDFLHFMLSGVMATERTIASTSQLLDPVTGGWNTALMRDAGIPERLFLTPDDPGRVMGLLHAQLRTSPALRATLVVAPASHDTGSAVAAVPAHPDTNWAYLSSGTWSLLGVERAAPLLTPETRAAGFTNERGVAGTYRVLKNIVGLWMIQELRRDLDVVGTRLDYDALADLAAAESAFRTLVDVDRPQFLSPGGMIEKVREFARETRQPVPETPAQFARACVDSLALAYAQTLDLLARVTGSRPEVLHLVGGGARHDLLNRLTADIARIPVLVGPFEATAVGNILTQAAALCPGGVRIADLRRATHTATRPVRLDPRPFPEAPHQAADARARYAALAASVRS
jgi:sugar (pentulose or hexulose) kinase